ncbi:MAG: transglycosylase SLT domain-containing protein [Elusimicrobiota bacterium]|jgi:soluble lytic murein transglycosylase-like protein
MRATPLAAAALLLSVGLSVRAEGVRVLVRVPTEETPEVQAKIAQSGAVAVELLRPPVRSELYRKMEEPAQVQRFTAAGWLEGMSPEKKLEGIRRLEAIWGKDAVQVVDESDVQVPTPAIRQEAVDFLKTHGLAQGAKGIDKALTGFIQKDGFVSFDQGTLRSGAGSVVASNDSAAPNSFAALSAAPAAGGGLHIDAVPSPGADAAPKGPYEDFLQAEAKAAGVEPAVLRALVSAKGGFSSSPSRVSHGSYGLLLITPLAAKSVGLAGQDLRDPEINLRAGALLLKNLLDRYNGDVHRALAAYQLGTGAVTRSGGLPNDRALKAFLADYERAYRQGPEKPKVAPVVPPKVPAVRQVVETAKDLKYSVPAAGKDPVARYRKMIEVVARRRGLDPDLIEAMMRAENPWGDPMRVSGAGAVGLMQLMPDTARGLKVDPRNPEQSVDGAARHLKWLLEYFDGDKVLAVAAYNAGHVPVQKLGRIPRNGETPEYVRKVSEYKEQISGEGLSYATYMPPPRTAKAHRNRSRNRR